MSLSESWRFSYGNIDSRDSVICIPQNLTNGSVPSQYECFSLSSSCTLTLWRKYISTVLRKTNTAVRSSYILLKLKHPPPYSELKSCIYCEYFDLFPVYPLHLHSPLENEFLCSLPWHSSKPCLGPETVRRRSVVLPHSGRKLHHWFTHLSPILLPVFILPKLPWKLL